MLPLICSKGHKKSNDEILAEHAKKVEAVALEVPCARNQNGGRIKIMMTHNL